MTGSMSVQGMDIPLTISKQHLKGMRLDMEIMGSANYQVANPQKGWIFMPVMGMTAPEEMPAEQLNSVLPQLDIQGGLVDYQAKGTKIEYAGKEKAEGTEAYKLLVERNGKKSTLYIDTKTNRLIKQLSKVVANGQEMDSETIFADYKQNKDGYWFAYSITSNQGTIVIDNVETNIAIPESTFTN
jgi:hypothetical protein